MRTKLDRPEALAILSGGKPESVIETSGMKKQATAAPWMIVGTISVAMSTWVLNRDRSQLTSANNRNDAVAVKRGSIFVTVCPMTGDISTASTPTGASTKPASVAV